MDCTDWTDTRHKTATAPKLIGDGAGNGHEVVREAVLLDLLAPCGRPKNAFEQVAYSKSLETF